MAAGGYANLLPELLLALVGGGGDVFVPSQQQEQGGLVLSDVVDWVTPPER